MYSRLSFGILSLHIIYIYILWQKESSWGERKGRENKAKAPIESRFSLTCETPAQSLARIEWIRTPLVYIVILYCLTACVYVYIYICVCVYTSKSSLYSFACLTDRLLRFGCTYIHYIINGFVFIFPISCVGCSQGDFAYIQRYSRRGRLCVWGLVGLYMYYSLEFCMLQAIRATNERGGELLEKTGGWARTRVGEGARARARVSWPNNNTTTDIREREAI